MGSSDSPESRLGHAGAQEGERGLLGVAGGVIGVKMVGNDGGSFNQHEQLPSKDVGIGGAGPGSYPAQ